MDACARGLALPRQLMGITSRWVYLTDGNKSECATMQAATRIPSRKDPDDHRQTSPLRIPRGDDVRPSARGQLQTPGTPDDRSR